jgi:hypothetical protein
MLEKTPLVPRIVSHNDLLIQGIIFRVTFLGPLPEHQYPDEYEEWCRIKVKDEWHFTCLTFYGHNRAQLTAERQGKEQEFLLLRRRQSDCALMLIDREGETAKRIGVASLVNLSEEDLWIAAKPEVRLIKLT